MKKEKKIKIETSELKDDVQKLENLYTADPIQLKGGFTTNDPRLDRMAIFDARSRNFPVIRTVGKAQMVSKVWDCPVTLDQGREGACVGFGIAHELLSEPAAAPPAFVTDKYAKEEIYWPAQKIDRKPGGSYPGAFPRYEGTSVLAGIKIVKRLGWIEGYEWSFGLRDLILGVGNQGPAVLGIIWTDSMYETDKNGFVYPQKGIIVGGHCILCRGVNVAEKYFILRNSWGKLYGKEGDCYISFGDMEYLLAQNGEAVFFKGRRALI